MLKSKAVQMSFIDQELSIGLFISVLRRRENRQWYMANQTDGVPQGGTEERRVKRWYSRERERGIANANRLSSEKKYMYDMMVCVCVLCSD